MSKTAKSKKYNRPSALKHGAFSGSAFFPWENRAEFEVLHMELVDEWDPRGAFEEESVFTIANCIWKKRRIREKRQLEVLADLRAPDPQSAKETTPFFEERIQQIKFLLSNKSTAVAPPTRKFNYDEAVLLELSASFYGNMSEQSLSWKFLNRNKFTDHLEEAIPRKNYPDFIDYIRALKTEVDEVLLPRVRKEQPSDDYIAAKTASEFLTAERIMEDLALEERLDATMDKAIRRLAQAKMLKQVSGLDRPRRSRPPAHQIDVEKANALNSSKPKC